MSPYVLRTDKTWSETRGELGRCFDQWGVAKWTAEANVPPTRVNGRSFSRDEAAVTVRYTRGEREIVLTMSTQDSPAANLRALYLCLDAMRLLDVRGLGETARSAYLQLEPPKSQRDPFEVLGLRPNASREQIEAMFRLLAQTAHPDRGGSNEAMAELNAARAAALGEATPA